MKDFSSLAKDIVKYIGGENNIVHLEHCSTRLRFTLADNKKVDLDKLKSLKGVISVIMTGQCQVVIGNDVIEVYDAVMKLGNFGGGTVADDVVEKKSIGAVIFDFIVGVFQPLIPAIAGAGMLKALLTLLTLFNIMSADDIIYKLFYYTSDASLYFIPLMVAVTAATKLKCNRITALGIVGTLLIPSMTTMLSEGASIGNFTIQNIAYPYQVFPAILCVIFLSFVEKFITKICPKPVRVFMVPLICMIIVAPITLFILGPLGFEIGSLLTKVILAVQSTFGWIAVAILAAILPLMVSTGMHKALGPYALSSITELGYEVLYMGASLAHNISESGACFAVALRTKDEDLRSTAISAGISALFGITEPALYGVTLQNKGALKGVIAGGFVSGAVIGLAGVKAFVAMGPGLAGMAMYVDPDNSMNIVWAFIGFAIALLGSFIFTFILYRENQEDTNKTKETQKLSTQLDISSPLDGEAIELSQIQDEVFRSGVLGDGIAIIPENDELKSPIDGVVSTLTDTKHAIGLENSNGVEMLMHIGMDTVQLAGEGFDVKVNVGDTVKKGQTLIKFNKKLIENKGYDLTTPVVITNSDDVKISDKIKGYIKTGQSIMKLEGK